MSEHINSFKRVEDSRIEMSQLMLPSFSNFSGKIHGGYILSVMDQVAFACSTRHSGMYCVTASVERVEFLSPIEVGDLVTFKAQINYVGKSSMVVGIRVEKENIKTGEKNRCNSSYFTMVAKNEEGVSTQVPGLIISNDNEIRRFLRAAHQMENIRDRKQEFSGKLNGTGVFKQENYLKKLSGYNVKIEL